MENERNGKTRAGTVSRLPGLNALSLNRVKRRENSPFPFRAVHGNETEKVCENNV